MTVRYLLLDAIIPKGGVIRFGCPPAPECWVFVQNASFATEAEARVEAGKCGAAVVEAVGPYFKVLEDR